MTQQKLVLVTGATGYLGSHCVKACLDKGYKVRGTVRSLKNQEKLTPIRQLDPTVQNLELVEADLMKKQGWKEAVTGCYFVLHVASPLPLNPSQETIDTAVTGTMNVLEACANEPSIKKVVLTSSTVATCGGHRENKAFFTTNDWTDVENTTNYYFKSKAIAEQKAWNFVKAGGHINSFPMTTINPGWIVGPALTNEKGTSAEIATMLMTFPMVPKLTLYSIDVRDCALAHIAAMENHNSDGLRVFCLEDNYYSMSELNEHLKKEFHDQGYSPSTCNLPSFFIKLGACFSSQMESAAENLDKDYKYDTTNLREVLKIQPRDTIKSIIEMIYDLIERGHIKKSPKYRGRRQELAPIENSVRL